MLRISELKTLVQQTLLGVNPRNALSKIVEGLCHQDLGAFLARRTSTASNVTGGGTLYTVLFSSTLYDANSNFNVSTGEFTASVAGVYVFSGVVHLSGIDASHTLGELSLVGPQTYTTTFNPAASMNSSNEMSISIGHQMTMAVGDTLSMTLLVSGGSDTIDVYGSSGAIRTCLAGHLLP